MTTRAARKDVVVMKFGGTSVADPEKIQRAAERAIAERRKGRGVVVVVSAPGDMTDELLTLAERVTAKPDERELDQLISTGEQVAISLFAMACRARGVPAVSLTGPQAGIEAAGVHGRANIRRVRTRAIRRELTLGRIVVVAGFQARLGRDVATLGRGGSDLTAVALACALGAETCEIFTDVKGVYTADPRVVYEARRLERITFDEMLELADAGAQVMMARSLEVAARRGVSIHVRSAFHPIPGTWIVPTRKAPAARAGAVSALALDKAAGAKLSVVGRGFAGDAAIVRTLRQALAAHKIKSRTLSATDLRISVAVDARHGEAAMRALHTAYGLAKKPRR